MDRVIFLLCWILLFICPIALADEWWQKGQDVDGEAGGDESGLHVAVNYDGSVMAVGAKSNDGVNGADSGHVRVFVWTPASKTWVQRGNDIDGKAAADQSGTAVALNDDGNIVAIGAPLSRGASASPTAYVGHVRVFVWSSGSWTQRGADINGVADGDRYGSSVAISGDGSIVAGGAPLGGASDTGYVRIFIWQLGSWNLRGATINGESAGDSFGGSISISGTGNVIAVGAALNAGSPAATSRGSVRAYVWNSATSNWQQRGLDIDGEAAGDQFGFAVSLNDDGTVLAAGADFNDGVNGVDSGSVRVFAWTNNAWTQRGGSIDGAAASEYFGRHVSISGNGLVVVGGAPFSQGLDSTSTMRGSAR
eukprot:gene37301-45287_t